MKREGRGRIVNAKILSLPRKLVRRPPPPPAEPVDEIDDDQDHDDDQDNQEGSGP